MATKNNPTAFMATHPGEILAAELEERGLTQKTFAEQTGLQRSHLSELINGKRPMTISIADRLEDALGIDSQSWMNLQTQYNYDVKALAEKSQSEKTATLQVSVSDTSIIADIKRAISLIRGVDKVAIL